MNTALWQLVLTRFREFFRRPGAVFWVYGFPLVLAMILGLAFQNRPVERIPVDVSSEGTGGAEAAAAVKTKLERDPRVTATVGTDRECRVRLRSGKTGLVIVPISGPGRYEYVSDPTRPESVLSRSAADSALVRADTPGLSVPTDVAFEEPGGRYIDFLLPGLIGLNLMGGGLWGVGFVVVDLRVRKLLKRFMATPMRKTDFLLALLLSRAAFTIVEVVILLAFGWLAFGVGVRGDPLALAVLVVLGAACFGGVGLLVACRVETIESVSGLMQAVMLPMYLLGGVFFSADRFPDWLQPLIQTLPMTPLLDGMRAVMNDGAGWATIARPTAILAAWAVVCFAVALRYFKWR
jgi:ABC-2 type transport system permease protein